MGLKKCKECSAEVSTKAKACPKCGAPAPTNSWGLKIGGAMILMATCTALAGRSGNGSSVSAASLAGSPQAARSSQTATPPVELSALALYNAYDANEVAADNAYKGQPLHVTGTVSSIDKDFTDNIILDLKAANEFMGVRAYLEDAEKSTAAGLQKGSRVAVLCTGGGKIVGSPVLRDCTLR